MIGRVAYASLVLAVLAAGCGRDKEAGEAGRPLPNPDASAELPILPIGGDFTLTDQHGQPFTLSSLRGKVVLVFFGYTMCPDACPTTLSKLSSATAKLTDAERARVKVIYITVDPERDTPAVMKEHLSYFSVDAIGLTGSIEDTTRTAAQFGAHFEKTSDKTAAGYLMSHTVSIFGLDAGGQTRLLIDYEAGVDLVVKEIRSLLAAVPSAASAPAGAKAERLFREVMSPFCPGLTLADCPSPNAFTLRNEVKMRLARGESREAIAGELVAQYGTSILSDPSDTPIGSVVWGVPIAVSALAALALAVFVRRATRARHDEPALAVAGPHGLRERLDDELDRLD